MAHIHLYDRSIRDVLVELVFDECKGNYLSQDLLVVCDKMLPVSHIFGFA